VEEPLLTVFELELPPLVVLALFDLEELFAFLLVAFAFAVRRASRFSARTRRFCSSSSLFRSCTEAGGHLIVYVPIVVAEAYSLLDSAKQVVGKDRRSRFLREPGERFCRSADRRTRLRRPVATCRSSAATGCSARAHQETTTFRP
jgi:hypothetical protein